jgi:DNA-binding beta-propeller fold protein YncE
MDTSGTTGAEPLSDTLLSVEHAGVLPGGAIGPAADDARDLRARRRGGRILTPRARRAVMWALLALTVALIGAGIWSYLNPRDGSVPLAAAPKDATSTITFAGSFPADPEQPLVNPLGVAVIGERVFVAESDAGVIREFAADGGRVRTIALPRASEAKPAYPADLAVIDENTLAVMEAASARVLVVSLGANADEPIALGVEDLATAPKQPTAVARLADGIAVADGRDHDIKVYDTSGAYLRTLGAGLEPPLTFPGGMSLVGGRLYVADSNSGRVLALDPETGAQVGALTAPLQLPRGIAAVDGGRLLVVSTFGRSLTLFDAVGTLTSSVTPHSDGIDSTARLVLPRGVAWMAATGRAYVSDAGSGRIRVYNVAAAAGK